MGRQIKNYLMALVHSHLVSYPSPINLNYAWSFGSLAGIALVLQIITGVILAMHYVPNIDYAFNSVEHIMRNVNHGWFFRYAHANGASMFIIVFWGCYFFINDGYCFYRLCFALGSNEFLGCNSYYKSFVSEDGVEGVSPEDHGEGSEDNTGDIVSLLPGLDLAIAVKVNISIAVVGCRRR